MRQKTVGIIGGMGPEATVDLMQRVIQATPANDDQLTPEDIEHEKNGYHLYDFFVAATDG